MTANPSLEERVARALCRQDANKHGIWFDDEALNKHILNNWRKFLEPARAAITGIPPNRGWRRGFDEGHEVGFREGAHATHAK